MAHFMRAQNSQEGECKRQALQNTSRVTLEIAKRQGRFTIFSLVDALTRATQKSRFAGERVEADAKVSSLLALAA